MAHKSRVLPTKEPITYAIGDRIVFDQDTWDDPYWGTAALPHGLTKDSLLGTITGLHPKNPRSTWPHEGYYVDWDHGQSKVIIDGYWLLPHDLQIKVN